MLTEILSPQAAVAEAYGDIPGATLFPAEEGAVARAVGKRRQEFTTARACARTALARLGVPPVPIVRGPDGVPQWPPGVVGSITHCAGYRASVVAWAADIVTIGLDAEPDGPLPAGVLGIVSSAAERRHLAALAEAVPGPSWDRLLFSAKECVYKAWFPLTARWLGFEEAEVSISTDGHFAAQLLVPGPVLDGQELTGFDGRWLARNGLVVTTIAVPARAVT
jgi:4'-phosphopantetheinyl transferase EntD